MILATLSSLRRASSSTSHIKGLGKSPVLLKTLIKDAGGVLVLPKKQEAKNEVTRFQDLCNEDLQTIQDKAMEAYSISTFFLQSPNAIGTFTTKTTPLIPTTLDGKPRFRTWKRQCFRGGLFIYLLSEVYSLQLEPNSF